MEAREFPSHDALVNRMTLDDCMAQGYSFFGWCGSCPDFVDVRATDLIDEAHAKVPLGRLNLRHSRCGAVLELRIHPVQSHYRLRSQDMRRAAVDVAA